MGMDIRALVVIWLRARVRGSSSLQVLGVHVAVAVHVKVNDNVNDHGQCSLT
jgi:hypothetical protein